MTPYVERVAASRQSSPRARWRGADGDEAKPFGRAAAPAQQDGASARRSLQASAATDRAIARQRKRAISLAESSTGKMARVTGLEPAASGVTGRRSNQLSYTRAWRGRATRAGPLAVNKRRSPLARLFSSSSPTWVSVPSSNRKPAMSGVPAAAKIVLKMISSGTASSAPGRPPHPRPEGQRDEDQQRVDRQPAADDQRGDDIGLDQVEPDEDRRRQQRRPRDRRRSSARRAPAAAPTAIGPR